MDKRGNNLSSLSDAQLAALAKEKNYEAFFEIEIRYEERVFRHVLKSVFNVPLARDIASRTFDAALKDFVEGKYQEQGKLLNWLFRISRKIHAMDIKEQVNNPTITIDDEIQIKDDEPDTSERERLLLIGRAIRECSQKERIPFILYFIKLMDWEQIGLRLGIKPGSARKDGYRCRMHLWKLLGKA
jgi:DNA-directed RNA polymerase specialized sigma24 family protein